MDRDKIAIGALWIVCVLSVLWAIYTALRLAEAILPAIVAGFATLMAAILTHAFTQAREYDLKRRQLMQENYRQIIEMIAPYVRKPQESKDQLDTAHLLSWVVGSYEVLHATQKFVDDPDTDRLADLLAAMRHDVGASPVPRDLAPNVLKELPRPAGLREGDRPLLGEAQAVEAQPIAVALPPNAVPSLPRATLPPRKPFLQRLKFWQ
jgi:hypothetical protein